MYIPDNPVITAIERHGYPEPWDPPLCESCQGEMSMGESLFRVQTKWICGECLRAEIEDLTTEELAELLDYQIMKVGECTND